MKKDYTKDPRSIKYHINNFLIENQARIQNKTVVDIPAGNGVTSKILRDLGANPLPFDLFPHLFEIQGIECKFADVSKGIKLDDGSCDWLICQEGIEHFSDQQQVMKEFSRVLKQNGTLIITTPNYSNLRSKLSYLFSESERFTSQMPVNEADSIWMVDQSVSKEVYFGHAFLIGIQRLRMFARLAGFTIKNITFTRLKSTSALLMLVFYPLILLFNTITYLKRIMKTRDNKSRRDIYKEVYLISINPKLLVDGHLFVEFEKTETPEEVLKSLGTIHIKGGIT